MTTGIDEVAPGIYRLADFIPAVNRPAGLTFCEFLIDADEPMLFHCGHRARFADLAEAVTRVMPLEKLRWVSYSHVEADESGALNEWLGAAPNATVAHGGIGANVWLRDYALRPPRVLKDSETMDLGGKRVRFIATPHLPHGWDSGLIHEEITGTLFTSDLFAQGGDAPALGNGDIVGPATALEDAIHATALTPTTAPILRKLAELKPQRLALMHGPTYTGDAAAGLEALAAHYEKTLRSALA